MSGGSENSALYFIKFSKLSNIFQIDTLGVLIQVGTIFLPTPQLTIPILGIFCNVVFPKASYFKAVKTAKFLGLAKLNFTCVPRPLITLTSSWKICRKSETKVNFELNASTIACFSFDNIELEFFQHSFLTLIIAAISVFD